MKKEKQKEKQLTLEEQRKLQTLIGLMVGSVITDEIQNKVLPNVLNGEIARLQKENTELQEKVIRFDRYMFTYEKEISELKEKLKQRDNVKKLIERIGK